MFAPGKRDLGQALSAAHHLLVSHGLAVQALRIPGTSLSQSLEMQFQIERAVKAKKAIYCEKPTAVTTSVDTEIGRVVVETGLATRAEIDYVREQQKQSSDPNQRSLADLLVENSFITVNQAKRLRSQLDERKSTSQIPGYQLIAKVGKLPQYKSDVAIRMMQALKKALDPQNLLNPGRVVPAD